MVPFSAEIDALRPKSPQRRQRKPAPSQGRSAGHGMGHGGAYGAQGGGGGYGGAQARGGPGLMRMGALTDANAGPSPQMLEMQLMLQHQAMLQPGNPVAPAQMGMMGQVPNPMLVQMQMAQLGVPGMMGMGMGMGGMPMGVGSMGMGMGMGVGGMGMSPQMQALAMQQMAMGMPMRPMDMDMAQMQAGAGGDGGVWAYANVQAGHGHGGHSPQPGQPGHQQPGAQGGYYYGQM